MDWCPPARDGRNIHLSLTGTPAIECRSGGDYTLVFTFVNPLASVGGASVTSGTGTVSNSAIGNKAQQYIVSLTGVANAQRLGVTLNNVRDVTWDVSNSISVSMGVLVGDVNASARVDAADVSLVRQQTLQDCYRLQLPGRY